MSIQKTLVDIGSGARDTYRSAIERNPQKALRATDEFVEGAKDLAGNFIRFVPTAAEVAGAFLAPEFSVPLATLSVITAKQELAANQRDRANEMGRVTTPLPSGSFAQNKASRQDPSHILHRNTKSLADRTFPLQGSRPDSAVLPPDESTNVPRITSKSSLPPLSALTVPVSSTVPTADQVPKGVHPASTGGARVVTSTSPFT